MVMVSISDLRNNISQYIQKASKGVKVMIRDEKKNLMVAQITKIKSFDREMFQRVLLKASGIITKENHPEWATKLKVVDWLSKSRLSDDRTF